jgi:hypothetical protein
MCTILPPSTICRLCETYKRTPYGGYFQLPNGEYIKKNGPNEDFGDFTEDQLEYLTKRFKMKDKCCGTCKFWHRTGPTSGICKALVGRMDVPPWAPTAANSCRNQDDYSGVYYSACLLWTNKE